MSVQYTYKTNPLLSATVDRFSTRANGTRTVTITKSGRDRGGVLLDFNQGGDKMIVSAKNVEAFVAAVQKVHAEGVAS